MENINNQNTNATTKQVKKSKYHWFVQVWLGLMIAGNIFTITSSIREISQLTSIASIITSIINLIAVRCLLSEKKSGFWLIVFSSIISMIVNIVFLGVEFAVLSILIGIISPLILWAILQIKKDGVSAWKHLK